MASDVTITYLNATEDNGLQIRVYGEIIRDSAKELIHPWKMINGIGAGGQYVLTYPAASQARAVWDGGLSRTQPLWVKPQQRGFDFVEQDGAYVLVPGDSPPEDLITITNTLEIPGGMGAWIQKSGSPLLQQEGIGKGDSATFEVVPKLYWAVAVEGKNPSDFAELDLAGLESLTWTLTGDRETGFEFTASHQKPS